MSDAESASAHQRARRGRSWAAPVSVALLALCALSPAGAQDAPPAPPPEGEGEALPVSHFDVRYDAPGQDLPPLAQIVPERVRLGRTARGYAAPRPGLPLESVAVPREPGAPVRSFHPSAVGEIASQMVARLRERGLMGVYVAPHPQDVHPRSERDLRREGDTVLRLVVSVGRVRELRSVGFGSRLPEDWRIDNPAHRRLRDGSPIQPVGSGREGATSLVDRDVLEEYLHHLNRHPGRRVDAALAPAEDGAGVSLDYRVAESRPWTVYGQVSDTGTDTTNPWQVRVGAVHHQLTNRDDTLGVEYLNAAFDDDFDFDLDRVHAVSVGYEAPWFGPGRPRALREDADLPSWIDWAPLHRLPWIGAERLRWRVSGSWTRTRIDDILGEEGGPSLAGFDFEGTDWQLGGRLIANVFQHRAFFLDLYGGLRVRFVSQENESLARDVSEYLFLPEIGLRAERRTDVSSLFADVALEGPLNAVDDDEVDDLGRIDASRRWLLLRWEAGASHYLEPLLFPDGWKDPSRWPSTLAHELSLQARGQWAFERRLVPQVSQVVGGLFSVRGYPQSLASGDSVAVGTLEYRFHLARSLPRGARPLELPFLGEFRAVPQGPYGRADWDLVVAAFADAGRTWRHDPLPFEGDDTLVGAGVGLELQLGSHVRARVDWARALHSAGPTGDRTESGDHRFHFLFSVVY